MARCRLACALTLALLATPVFAQDNDGIGALLHRLEQALPAGDPATLRPLLSPNVAPGVMDTFAPRLLAAPFRRAVIQEREREPLDGALPGDGYRLTADLLLEDARTARIVTARLDVRRAPGDGSLQAWRLVSAQVVTVVEGLHRLRPDPERQFAVQNLTVRSEDLEVTFSQGTAVPIESELGLTGMVIVGTGQMTFLPRPAAERGQVRLFAGSDVLVAPIDAVYLRVHPDDVAARGLATGLQPQPVDPRVLRRAREIFEEDAPRSFSLDLGDLSRELWFVLPPRGDFLAELRTRGRGHLTYVRSFTEAEDISLFERARGRDISRYASLAKEAQRGVTYDEDALSEVKVLDYDIDATIDPVRQFIDARARLTVRVQAAGVSTLSIRLAEPLTVTSAVSPRFGPLVHLRVRGRDSVLLNLPAPLQPGSEVVFAIAYSGRLPSQAVDQEAMGQDGFPPPPAPLSEQDYYLLSTKSYWYPQPETSNYASATLRLTLPADFTCVASGEPLEGFRSVVAASGRPMRAWAFRAFEPVRYLSVVAARFRPVVAGTLPLVDEPSTPAVRPAEGSRQPGFRVREYMPFDQLATNGVSGRRLTELSAWTADIFAFYRSKMGDAPYSRLTLAVVENATPGGHSPAATALVFHPRAGLASWRDDPASFDGFPEFFLAHELAHQWWGHGVGWANYHEQWLSEGFAQYFAALYAEHKRGAPGMEQMLRQFREWTLEASPQGPISLGYRLGQLKGDRRVFRALVYNKAAGVLHMLRRLLGDEAFFDGLRRLYADRRLEKAGTAHVQAAFEAASGRPLGRFFEQWIGESRLPRVRVTQAVTAQEAVVTFEHLDGVFDLPVTVSLVYADGRVVEAVVPVTEQRVERRLPLEGPLRQVRVNRDSAALAVFEGL